MQDQANLCCATDKAAIEALAPFFEGRGGR